MSKKKGKGEFYEKFKKNIAIMLTFAMLSVLLCNIDAKADNLIDYTEDIYEMDCMQPYLEIINEVN